MDCRTFRDNHLAFIDDALVDAELVAMQRHLSECSACAKHDVAVRRALLVFRNLPQIQPSANFQARLDARLGEVRRAALRGPAHRGPGIGTFTATAASLIAAGYLFTAVLERSEQSSELSLAPVVATLPAVQPTPDANQALVTSVSSGMPLWPTALFAEQAPVHFVNSEFQLASWTR